MGLLNKNNISHFLYSAKGLLILFAVLSAALQVAGQEEKTVTIKMDFIRTDTSKICKATVLADSIPVEGPEVHLYVKSLYALLPVGKVVATDESGVANIDFPMDLPGDRNGLLTVIAKIEGDETYGDAETQAEIKWGVVPDNESFNWSIRSLAASREKAPMFLVIASTLIIIIIWGTIFYIGYQLFRIKKSGKMIKANPS
ncbi:MAG: hypothetical protein ACXWV2_06250 [Chitinophagaceae bacterium]